MSILQQIKHLFSSQPDFDEVVAFQYKLPRSITVEITNDGEYIIANVKKINDTALENDTVMTEAKTLPELISEVNDILLSYLEFPENIKPKMPQLLPSEIELQKILHTSHKQFVFAK